MTSKIYGRSGCVVHINQLYGFEPVTTPMIMEVAKSHTEQELDNLFVTLYDKLNPEEYDTSEPVLVENITKEEIQHFRCVWLAWLYLAHPDMVALD